jgi:hypothetical protein
MLREGGRTRIRLLSAHIGPLPSAIFRMPLLRGRPEGVVRGQSNACWAAVVELVLPAAGKRTKQENGACCALVLCYTSSMQIGA